MLTRRVLLSFVLLAACSGRVQRAVDATPGQATAAQATDPRLRLMGPPTLRIAAERISLDGDPVVAVSGWTVEETELRPGAAALVISRLATRVQSNIASQVESGFWTNRWKCKIEAARQVPYRLLTQVIASAAEGGCAELTLAGDGGAPVELSLPPGDEPAPTGVQLAVAVTRAEVLLFSLSGVEGTLAKPAARVPARADASQDVDQLRAAASEIRSRHPDERTVIVIADAGIEVGALLPVVEALQKTAAGSPLLPDVRLSSL